MMETKTRLLLLAGMLLIPLGTRTAAGSDFYVAPNGRDTNPGTAQRPFATISRARDAARAVPQANTVILAPGRYFNEASIVLDDRDSGLSIRGETPGATAEVYGGVPVTGWQRWKGDIWRAQVPNGVRFFNLIVDGQPAPMAQWPKIGSGYGGGFKVKSNTSIEVPPEFRSYDFSDAQVRAWMDQDWFTEVRKPKDSAPDATGILQVDGGGGSFGMNPHIHLRGVLEFLTEPGEWCLKHQEGFLYYWPKTGSPADHLVVRATTQRTFDVTGRKPETPAKGVTLENLSIIGSDFCARWSLFGPGQDGPAFGPGQDGSTPAPLQQGMVFGENVEGLTVSGCRLVGAGQASVWFNHFAKNCVVENCLIMHSGFAGVYANGFMPGEGPFKSAAESFVNKGHRIENNFIFDFGRLAGGTGGIQFYQSGEALITRNEISQGPRYGISCKGERWGCLPKKLYGHDLTFATHWDYLHTRNNKIVGNDIHNVARESYDLGVIESWGPGRDNLWANNAIHDCDSAVNPGNGLMIFYSDDASHYLTIRDNIVYHCQNGVFLTFLKSIGQVFENNFAVDCKLNQGIWLDAFVEPAGDTTIRHNIIAGTTMPAPVAISGSRAKAEPGTAGKEFPASIVNFKELDYNIFQPSTPGQTNTLADRGFDTHSFFGDPKVLRAKPEWDITFRDYSLAPDSPALKLGFKPIDTSVIGLRPDFPFDVAAATRRSVGDNIQAEEYQRIHDLYTIGGTGIRPWTPAGGWAKYANIDFGTGATKVVFQLDGNPAGAGSAAFSRLYGDTRIEPSYFKGDGSVETITRWEISKPYTQSGKSGAELFDAVLPPEKDPQSGTWELWQAPVAGGTPGVVDFAAINGGGLENACAYARASIYAPSGRTNATMTITAEGGSKVWLNGELILAHDKLGTYSEISKGIIKPGWNTILVKVNQTAAANGKDGFSFKFGTVASSCGAISCLPGLPTEERDPILELHLDEPTGPLVAALPANKIEKLPVLQGFPLFFTPLNQAECPMAKNVSGVHNLYLVFASGTMNCVDWFKLEK